MEQKSTAQKADETKQIDPKRDERQKVIDTFCGYCGTGSRGTKVRLVCGNSTLLADEDVAQRLMEVKEKAEKPYWVKVCPACGFAVGVVM